MRHLNKFILAFLIFHSSLYAGWVKTVFCCLCCKNAPKIPPLSKSQRTISNSQDNITGYLVNSVNGDIDIDGSSIQNTKKELERSDSKKNLLQKLTPTPKKKSFTQEGTTYSEIFGTARNGKPPPSTNFYRERTNKSTIPTPNSSL